MSHHTAVANRVVALFTERLGIPPENVTPSAGLAADLGVDSVDAVEFTLALEREFNVTLPDTAFSDVKTVQDVIDLLCETVDAPSEVASD